MRRELMDSTVFLFFLAKNGSSVFFHVVRSDRRTTTRKLTTTIDIKYVKKQKNTLFDSKSSACLSLRSTQFRSISLCWKMSQISSVFLLAIHSHFILPHLASCHHPTKDTKTFPIPSHQSFFNVSTRVFCRRVITSACSFLLYLAWPVHLPFTLPSTFFSYSIQQFSTSHLNVFGLHVTASPHLVVSVLVRASPVYHPSVLSHFFSRVSSSPPSSSPIAHHPFPHNSTHATFCRFLSQNIAKSHSFPSRLVVNFEPNRHSTLCKRITI